MEWQEELIEIGILYGQKLVSALLIFFIGKWLIKLVVRKINSVSEDVFDETLSSFIKSISKTIFYILLFFTIGSTLGIAMTSFIAVFSAIAFAVGLSLQGGLQNFAGGVLILASRSFNVEDFIEIPDSGLKGKVKSIKILYTTLITRDNKRVVIPNGELSNNNIINYNSEPNRRVDLVFGIGYDDEINEVKQFLKDIVQKHDLVLDEPQPLIRVGEYADSSVNINCYVWCETQNYWDVYYDLMEEVKMVFDREGINIPYPQRDIHLVKEN